MTWPSRFPYLKIAHTSPPAYFQPTSVPTNASSRYHNDIDNDNDNRDSVCGFHGAISPVR
jgi:hypothetical protein